MEYIHNDEPHDMKYIKKSFKQLRKSKRRVKAGIESYTSSLKRMSQNEINNQMKTTPETEPFARSIDDGNKKGRFALKPEPSDLKSKVRNAFTSPNKQKTPSQASNGATVRLC